MTTLLRGLPGFRAGLPVLGRTAMAAMLLVASEGPARAEDVVADCIAAADEGQRERDGGHLRSARARFLVCSAQACPMKIANECVTWLADVDARIPTMTFAPVDPQGKDVMGARISIDGRPLATEDAGRETPLEPGTHTVRSEAEGFAPVTQTIMARERERGRILSLTMLPLRSDPPAGAAGRDVGSPSHAPPRVRRVPTAAWITGAVGVGGLAGFGVLYGLASTQANDLACAPYCSQAETDGPQNLWKASLVALGVGAVGAIATVVILVTSSSSAPRASARDLAAGRIRF